MMTNRISRRHIEKNERPDEIKIAVDFTDLGVRPIESSVTPKQSCTVYMVTGPESETEAGEPECSWWIL
jgi:hypothetical protein